MADLLTANDLADELDVSPATLRSWRFRGVGPAFLRLPSGTIRYERAEVDRFLWAARRGRRVAGLGTHSS